ncbi:MAG: FKBP-type peptidyl-prolyl cis-trans isomerase [Planctomycetia bacterium]|nr:FKBP-type peptidyl-prolyl cis-trans isomerase [Planctomycetia bacterium]
MAQADKTQPEGFDKDKLKRILVPAAAVAGVVVIVALVALVSGGSDRKMSDGSDGSANDPNLKEAAPGVKYRDIKEGVGEPCKLGAEVKYHVTGWVLGGNTIENSREKGGQPRKAGVNGLFPPGLSEGIIGMKQGGVRKVVITPEKGFGPRGTDKVPANSTLVYEVELVEVSPPRNVTTGPGQPMPFDKSNGGTDDPDLKDIGEGLKYRDLKEGTGEPVKPGAQVTIHYTGWTVDGKVFDNSRPRGKPNTWRLGDLVPGWQKGIPGMKPGGVRKLVVPAALAYGDRGQGEDIPPGATLIFEVELVQ